MTNVCAAFSFKEKKNSVFNFSSMIFLATFIFCVKSGIHLVVTIVGPACVIIKREFYRCQHVQSKSKYRPVSNTSQSGP